MAEGDLSIAGFVAVAVVIVIALALTFLLALRRSPGRPSRQTILPRDGNSDEEPTKGRSPASESSLPARGADVDDLALEQDGSTYPHFYEDEAARKYLEQIRWPGRAVCPYCGEKRKTRKLRGKGNPAGLRACGACESQFTVTTGTVFEDSPIPLHIWFRAIHLLSTGERSMGAYQLHRALNVNWADARMMRRRIHQLQERLPSTGLFEGTEPVMVGGEFWDAPAQSGRPRSD